LVKRSSIVAAGIFAWRARREHRASSGNGKAGANLAAEATNRGCQQQHWY